MWSSPVQQSSNPRGCMKNDATIPAKQGKSFLAENSKDIQMAKVKEKVRQIECFQHWDLKYVIWM